MYVYAKKVKKYDYNYVAESVRENGKVRKKHLAYLGKHRTLKAAIAGLKDEIRADQAKAEKCRTLAEEIWGRRSEKTVDVEEKCRELRIQASIFDKQASANMQKLDTWKALLARAPLHWQEEI